MTLTNLTHDEHRFRPGDRVRIPRDNEYMILEWMSRRDRYNINGWDCSWVEDMHRYFGDGAVYSVLKSNSMGVTVRLPEELDQRNMYPFRYNGYYWPSCVFVPADSNLSIDEVFK